MNHKNLFKIAYVVIAVTVIYSFNAVLFLNVKAYNILNIILFLVVGSHIAARLTDQAEKPRLFEFLISSLVLLAGINIQSKPKIFFFLLLLYSVYIGYYQFGFKTTAVDDPLLYKIFFIASWAVSCAIFILLLIHKSTLPLLLTAAALMLFSQISLFVFPFIKARRGSKGGTHNEA